jgi:ABC-type transport system involved in multi-copper enzyme maturation permease subunit
MDIILALVWILAMVLYSFSSDYAVSFPNHNYRALPFIRWGTLLIAMGLSAYLAQAYQQNLQGSGIWVFVVVVFIIIALSKLVFKWVIRRRR